jgi:hypothetical protein
MSNYGYSLASAKFSNTARPTPLGRVKKVKNMKLTIKQRFRNWLNDDNLGEDNADSVTVENNRLESDGMRLQVYRASGGYVVETRSYDRKNDRNHNTMHVITDEEDLGERIGKIIMMEALRG